MLNADKESGVYTLHQLAALRDQIEKENLSSLNPKIQEAMNNLSEKEIPKLKERIEVTTSIIPSCETEDDLAIQESTLRFIEADVKELYSLVSNSNRIMVEDLIATARYMIKSRANYAELSNQELALKVEHEYKQNFNSALTKLNQLLDSKNSSLESSAKVLEELGYIQSKFITWKERDPEMISFQLGRIDDAIKDLQGESKSKNIVVGLDYYDDDDPPSDDPPFDNDLPFDIDEEVIEEDMEMEEEEMEEEEMDD